MDKASRRLIVEIKQGLRDLRSQLGLLNRQVSSRLALREVDLDCLDLISRHGPLAPSALARLAGLHPATLTGIIDRLQRAGWVRRIRDPDAVDRRAVMLRTLPERNRDLFGAYATMDAEMDRVCGDFTAAELQTILEFLRRATSAGVEANRALHEEDRPPSGGRR